MHTGLEWFLSLPSRPSLRTARLYYLETTDLAIHDKFIRTFGNDLESLSLSTCPSDWTVHSIGATPLTRLRSIEFVIVYDDGSAAIQNRWVMQILSLISSACLESVVFKLQYRGWSETGFNDLSDVLEWHDADDALQRPTFSSLKIVHLLLSRYVKGVLPPLSEHLVEVLPQCHARRIVCVDQINEKWCSRDWY